MLGSMRARAALLAAVLLALGAAALLRGRPHPPAPPPPSARPTPSAPVAPAPSETTPRAFELPREERAARARRLRQDAIARPDVLQDLLRVLRDPSADPELRRAAAAILGSFPEGKRALVRVLREGAARGVERAVILAIGLRAIDDGDLFDRQGQPYAIEIAPGLVPFVDGPLEDVEAREELARRLADADPEIRRAAARVLRGSTADAAVRSALLERVGRDADPETSAEAGAALTAWTRGARMGDVERAAVLARVLEAADGADEIVHLRLANPLSTAPLDGPETARLRALGSSGDVDTRRFAMELLGRRMGLSREADETAAAAIARALLTDASADVREAAAAALTRASDTPQGAAALTQSLRQEADWEVRCAAARALAGARSEAAREALRHAAASDPREEVRQAASRALLR